MRGVWAICHQWVKVMRWVGMNKTMKREPIVNWIKSRDRNCHFLATWAILFYLGDINYAEITTNTKKIVNTIHKIKYEA